MGLKLRNIAFMLLLIAAPCFAGDVDGKWSGTMATPMGDVPVNFTFKADGAKLSGTSSSPGGDIAIKDGKADGNNISFSVTFDFGGMPFTMNYKGVVSASEIKFTIDVLGMPLDLVVKKTT